MKRLLLLGLALTIFAAPPARANPYSFFIAAGAGAASVPVAYDWTNGNSLVLSVKRQNLNSDQSLCIVNATASYVAVMLDWGDASSNPPGGGTNSVTSPELPLGPSAAVCPSRFGPNVFIRSMSGSAITSGYVYGYSR